MIKNSKIIIKKKHLIYYVFFFVLTFYFMRSVLSFPSAFSYTIDFVNIYLIYILINRSDQKKWYKCILVFTIGFLTYTVIASFINGGSIVLYTWALRSNFRFYIFMMGSIVLLTIKDYKYFFKMLIKFLYLNVIIVTAEYFIFGIRGDYLGGLFGIDSGCNGYMNIFLLLIISYAIIAYLNGKKKFIDVTSVVICGCYIAVLSELKSLFIEIAIIILVAILITRFSFKKLSVAILAIVAFVVVVNGISKIYPQWADSFSINGIIELASSDTGYTNQGDLNRLNAIAQINLRLDNSRSFNKLIGIGFGNGEYSDTFSFLQSDFYKTYGWWHYTWISYGWIYLELGYLGIIFFEGFFIFIFIICLRTKSINSDEKILNQTSAIISIMAIFLSIFNVSLRMESGYLIYLVLAIPFVTRKENMRIKLVEAWND